MADTGLRGRRSAQQRAIEDEAAGSSLPATELERVIGWFDRRTGVARQTRVLLRHLFPDHWSFLLGEVALYCFIVLVLTGTFLTFFFVPDAREQVYGGSYAPLSGQPVSAAFASVMRISFDVHGGLLFRQIHHWAALIFVVAIGTHLARVFFTAAFRKPRELNWILGVLMLAIVMVEGLFGYSLPDDLLSGTGIRILFSVLVSIPLVGPRLATLLFGGAYPTTDIINRLYVLHILLVPIVLGILVAIHVGLVFLQHHSQYKRGAARENNVVGLPLWPQQTFRSVGLALLTAGLLALFGGLLQINPVWLYGPYDAAAVSTPGQPDWYLMWLEGLLRLGPSFEPVIAGFTIPELFLPAIVVPFVIFVGMFCWPWIDARVSGSTREHNLLDHWWEQPFRAAVGAAFICGFAVATLAGANDVLGAVLRVPIEVVTPALLWTLLIGPIVAGLLTLAAARQRRAHEGRHGTGIAAHRPSSAVVVRNELGGFEEVDP